MILACLPLFTAVTFRTADRRLCRRISRLLSECMSHPRIVYIKSAVVTKYPFVNQTRWLIFDQYHEERGYPPKGVLADSRVHTLGADEFAVTVKPIESADPRVYLGDLPLIFELAYHLRIERGDTFIDLMRYGNSSNLRLLNIGPNVVLGGMNIVSIFLAFPLLVHARWSCPTRAYLDAFALIKAQMTDNQTNQIKWAGMKKLKTHKFLQSCTVIYCFYAKFFPELEWLVHQVDKDRALVNPVGSHLLFWRDIVQTVRLKKTTAFLDACEAREIQTDCRASERFFDGCDIDTFDRLASLFRDKVVLTCKLILIGGVSGCILRSMFGFDHGAEKLSEERVGFWLDCADEVQYGRPNSDKMQIIFDSGDTSFKIRERDPWMIDFLSQLPWVHIGYE